METVDALRSEIVRFVAAKERERRQLAAPPFPAKVSLVVQLPRIAAPILRVPRTPRPGMADGPGGIPRWTMTNAAAHCALTFPIFTVIH